MSLLSLNKVITYLLTNIAKVQLHDTVRSIQIPEALSVFLVAAGPASSTRG